VAEVIIPPSIPPSEETIELVDDSTVVFRPVLAGGLVQRQQFAAPRFRVTQKWKSLRLADRARMLAVCNALQGKYNTLRASVGFGERGWYATTPEMFANSDFSNGVTGWSVTGNMTVNDKVARVNAANGAALIELFQLVTPTAYAPYVVRCGAQDGFSSEGVNGGPFIGGGPYGNGYSTLRGLLETSGVTPAGSLSFGFSAQPPSSTVNTCFDFSYMSMKRCARVDLGNNLITYSNAPSNAAWSKTNISSASNAAAAPDGTTNSCELANEGTNTGNHFYQQAVTKSAADEDWTGVVYVKSGTASTVRLIVGDNGSNYGSVFYSTADGSIVAAAANAGSVSNARSAAVNMGNGWWRFSLTARIPSAITTTNVFAFYITNGATANYTGTSRTILVWRHGYSNSSLPFQPLATTSAPVYGSPPTTVMMVNGLPASTNGALLAGDFIQTAGELKQLVAPVNSDAAGCGVMRFTPQMVGAAINFAHIVCAEPMGRFILADNPKWTNQYGVYADLEMTFEHIYEP
jgi:hypothetical protein